MIRTVFFLIALVLPLLSFSQDYERVDAVVQLYPNRFNAASELSNFIERDFTSEENKVRAMYSWIVNNIAYDPSLYKKFDYSFTNYRDRNTKEEQKRKEIIDYTLQTGTAVCEGYAMLFERLCELSHIENFLVRGDVKASFEDIGRGFKTIHMWNSITLNGQQYLFDATWGAGKFTGKFVKEPSYYYYKTPPEKFIKTHYPVFFDDALLEKELPRSVFLNWPLIIEKALMPNDILAPSNGIISAKKNRNSIFKILNTVPQSVSYSLDFEAEKKVDFEIKEGVLVFEIPMERKKENLLIYFNGNPALGYKID